MRFTFRPKPIPTIATLIGIGLLIGLGTWQFQRHGEKLEQEAAVATQSTLPALPVETLPTTPREFEALSYRTITLDGTLDMSHAVLFKHRQYAHHPGFWIAAPLVMKDRRAIWTNLGWLPFDKGEALAKEMATHQPVEATYTGLFYVLPQNIADSRNRAAIARGDFPAIKDTLTQWHTYDIEALLALTPYAMGDTPAVLVLNESHSGDPFPMASTQTITQPYMTADRHKGYFLFWYITAGALFMLYLGASFGVIGSFARRRPSSVREEST